ncbi:MAG: hypothetical protein HUK22_04180, partial [Thermoguttaceae bacterium]|nr:hypothetical protein [Thermoguttaceae bacterium]
MLHAAAFTSSPARRTAPRAVFSASSRRVFILPTLLTAAFFLAPSPKEASAQLFKSAQPQTSASRGAVAQQPRSTLFSGQMARAVSEKTREFGEKLTGTSNRSNPPAPPAPQTSRYGSTSPYS